MRGKLGGLALVMVAALALGVGGAGGRSLAETKITVQVIGAGQVAGGFQITCGAGATSCYGTFTGTTSVALTASDDGIWTFSSWDCSAGGESASDRICTIDLDGGDHEVIATFTAATFPGSKTLTVTKPTGGKVEGADIVCGSGATETDCTDTEPTGSTLTVLAEADTDYTFSGWGGACSGSSVNCTVELADDRNLTATFSPTSSTQKLNVSVTGNGTVTGGGISCTSAGGSGCTADVANGTTVTLTATAGSGAGFTSWGGACAGTTTTCQVTMSSDRSVSADFTGNGGGGGGGGSPSTFPLIVSVTGAGTVTGGGIDCGGSSTTCSANEPTGSEVTLTARPSSGGSFTGWGGACSGTNTTCSVTMSAARSVTATFSGASSTEVDLTVSVTGSGRVVGGDINCGNGSKACSSKESEGASIGLTATPAAGASFTGWSGDCSGASSTCTIVMSQARNVSARFTTAPGSTAAGAAALQSRGRPIVTRTRTGFAVTLRFRTNRRGTVRVHALRAGRLETALSYTAPSGSATVGPFPLAKPGYYVFDLAHAGRLLRWRACLGVCGEAAGRKAGPFTLTRKESTVVDSGALWAVTLHFRSTQPAGIVLRVYRNRRLAREVRFPSGAGLEDAGPLLLSPATYTLRLSATDGYGRVRLLSWIALLP
jgi:uncharacterized repeat protein (TIGR02543 family)